MAVPSTQSINLELPVGLVERLNEAAAQSDKSLKVMLVESLALLFGTPHADRGALPDALETLPDAHLWALVYRRIAWPRGARLRELAESGRQGPPSDEAQAELTSLTDAADELTLLRSRALLVLRRRGHDIREQFQLGA